eukprot:SAG31_NODE_651_length_13184_cov_4.999541_8_plen_299_part_00
MHQAHKGGRAWSADNGSSWHYSYNTTSYSFKPEVDDGTVIDCFLSDDSSRGEPRVLLESETGLPTVLATVCFRGDGPRYKTKDGERQYWSRILLQNINTKSQSTVPDIPVSKPDLFVWPSPQSLVASGPPHVVDSNFTITADTISAANPVLAAGINRTLAILQKGFVDAGFPGKRTDERAGWGLQKLHVIVESADVTELAFVPGDYNASTDYSYDLSLDLSTSSTARLTAKTAFGALYGLETFIQLLDLSQSTIGAEKIKILDAPMYSWRGLMVDAGRRFWPVPLLKNVLDTMSAGNV